MRVVLLGGNGFIGYHISKCLSNFFNIVVVGRHIGHNLSELSNVEIYSGDCGNAEVLKKVIQPDDVVVYLAYASTPKTSFEHPLQDINENLPLAINIFSTLRDLPIKKLIFISSGGTVYGNRESHYPIKEISETNPISPYGITKLAIEKYANLYCKLFNLPVIIARPANPYGQFQKPFAGQGFIPTAIASILEGKDINIFGGNTVRDYIYIDDLVLALKILIETEIANGAIFNIGSGLGLNNIDILKIIQGILVSKNLNVETKINILPGRSFDVQYNVLDVSKMLELGWMPRTNIETGLTYTLNWFLQNQNIEK